MIEIATETVAKRMCSTNIYVYKMIFITFGLLDFLDVCVCLLVYLIRPYGKLHTHIQLLFVACFCCFYWLEFGWIVIYEKRKHSNRTHSNLCSTTRIIHTNISVEKKNYSISVSNLSASCKLNKYYKYTLPKYFTV